MATSRSTRPMARIASLGIVMALALGGHAWAGAPASLEGGTAVKPKPAATDTTKKTATKTDSKTASKSTAPSKAPVASTGTPTVAPAKPTSKPTTPAKTNAPPTVKPVVQPATVAAKPAGTPTVATKGTPTVAKVAPASGVAPKEAPSPSRASVPNPTVAKIPAGAKVAPAPTSNVAKITKLGPASPAVIPAGKTVTAGTTPSITRVAPNAAPVGPMISKQGGTTVNAPTPNSGTASITPIRSGAMAKPSKGGAVGAGVATNAASAKPGTTKSTGKVGVVVSAPLEDHVTYQYNALGRRDPFQSLMEGEYVGADVGGQAPPDLGGLRLVGVVWGSNDQFAMVEDARGDSYVLRRGDRVMNGYVEGLKREAMIVNITVDGQSQSVTIPITRKGEKSNANR